PSSASLVEAERLEEVEPEISIAQPNIKVLVGQPECTEALHQEANQLDLGLRTRFAEDIGVELKETASTALLHALVAVKLGDAEPFDGALECIRPGSDQPAHRRRHLRPQRDVAPAFVGEAEELRLDFIAGLRLVELEWL